MGISITASNTLERRNIGHAMMYVIIGTLFLIVSAQIRVPFYPVPMTLQTLAVFLLATIFGSRLAAMAVLCYLLEASVGLPVTASGSNPFWIIGPTGGYLLAFPLAAYCSARLLERKKSNSLAFIVLSFCCGQIIIYFLGLIWLSYFVGYQKAFSIGLLPFLFADACKIGIAASFQKGWQRYAPFLRK